MSHKNPKNKHVLVALRLIVLDLYSVSTFNLNRMSRCAQGIMGYCDIKNVRNPVVSDLSRFGPGRFGQFLGWVVSALVTW